MENLGYYNGEVGPLEQMRVPMLDRACYFGDGCYDAMMAHKGRLIFADAHLERFYSSCQKLSIAPPMQMGELRQLLTDLLARVDAPDVFVYWQATRGTAQRSHAFPDSAEVPSNLWVMLTPGEPLDVNATATLVSVEDKRFRYCDIKTLNLIPSVLAAQKAAEAGCDEAVFVRDGQVTECAHSNISILVDGTFVTHPLDDCILPGTARKLLVEQICPELGIPVEERPYALADLMAADEVILSASSCICTQVTAVDGKLVGGRDPQTLDRMRQATLAAWKREAGEC